MIRILSESITDGTKTRDWVLRLYNQSDEDWFEIALENHFNFSYDYNGFGEMYVYGQTLKNSDGDEVILTYSNDDERYYVLNKTKMDDLAEEQEYDFTYFIIKDFNKYEYTPNEIVEDFKVWYN